jgi:hypothetical protein
VTISSPIAMVRLQLSIKAQLENVIDFQPASEDEFSWMFQVR